MARIASLIRRAWAHAGFKKYFKNAGWMFGTKLFTMAVSFLATLYVTRALGPTNYGQLSYAVSFVALFGFLASLGTEIILYRDLVRFPERRPSLLGTVLAIRLAAGAAAAALAIGIGWLLSTDDVSTLLICILASAFVLNSFQIIVYDFQARVDPVGPSVVAAGISLLLNALKVWLVLTGHGVIYVALLSLLESILYALCYTYIYVRRTRTSPLSWRFDGAYARDVLRDSVPLVVFSAFSIIYARIDQVLIKHMLDARAVGIYGAAAQVAELWVFIPGIILSAVSPAIVQAKGISETLYLRRLGRVAAGVAVMSVVIAAAVSLLAPWIISLLYGAAYLSGTEVLRVYVWGFVGTALGTVITQYFVTENDRYLLTVFAIAPTVLNVVLNIIWIPSYGIVGAAYATLISYSAVPLMLFAFPRTRAMLAAMRDALRTSDARA